MDNLSEIFGTEERPLIKHERQSSGLVLYEDQDLIEQAKRDRRTNYVRVRENLDELVEEARQVVIDAVSEVRTNPSARMFETLSILMKTYSELNEQLITIPEKIIASEPMPEPEPAPQTINNNAIFVGTTDDLLTTIKNRVSNTLGRDNG